MARLPYVDPESAPAAVRSALELLPGIRIFRMIAHAETAFRPFLRLGSAILGELKLSPRLRELAILRVAQLSGAQYEWAQHVPFALRAGIAQEKIDALARGDTDGRLFDAEERAVLRFTTEAVERARASDDAFSEVAARLTPREIVELLLTIGYYRMVATLLESTGVDPDAPAGSDFVARASGARR
jgi:alkylhydroperoxidase family enzyme